MGAELKTDREAAKAAGDKFYRSSPCKHGHDGQRYTSNGQCLGCNMHRTVEEFPGSGSKRAAQYARSSALAAGEEFYKGQPCKHGHDGTRRVLGSLCVECERCRIRSTETYRSGYLKRSYGISGEDYDALVSEQEGRCGICGGKASSNLHVDHCHTSGEVRGLLCQKCNMGLGMFNDDPVILQAAVEYRKKYARKDPGGPEEAA